MCLITELRINPCHHDRGIDLLNLNKKSELECGNLQFCKGYSQSGYFEWYRPVIPQTHTSLLLHTACNIVYLHNGGGSSSGPWPHAHIGWKSANNYRSSFTACRRKIPRLCRSVSTIFVTEIYRTRQSFKFTDSDTSSVLLVRMQLVTSTIRPLASPLTHLRFIASSCPWSRFPITGPNFFSL